MDDRRRLLALCAIRIDGRSIDWSLLAREAQLWQGLDRMEAGHFYEDSQEAQEGLPLLRQGLKRLDEAQARVDQELALADRVGARLVTVLDEEYPVTLRAIFNLPPFLFVRGTLLRSDVRAVAVVGTRHPSEEGLARARKMAGLLAAEHVTVVSGLAEGIDTAAHTAALASNGRTIAVLGQGTATRVFPAANRDLAERICDAGALVSQFWPSTHPASWTFPRRNIVTSGISQGTVVVEASATSGAKNQARRALEHGKRVWLLRSLVDSQDWAQTYVARRGATMVTDVDAVIADLVDPDRLRDAASQQQQLALDVL